MHSDITCILPYLALCCSYVTRMYSCVLVCYSYVLVLCFSDDHQLPPCRWLLGLLERPISVEDYVLALDKSCTLFGRSIRKNDHGRNKRDRSRRHAVHRRQIISPKYKLISGFLIDTDQRIPGTPRMNNKIQIPNDNLTDIPAPRGQGNNLTNNAGNMQVPERFKNGA